MTGVRCQARLPPRLSHQSNSYLRETGLGCGGQVRDVFLKMLKTVFCIISEFFLSDHVKNADINCLHFQKEDFF